MKLPTLTLAKTKPARSIPIRCQPGTAICCFLTLATLWLAGCASTKLESSWTNPKIKKVPVQRVLVVAVTDSRLVRMAFENFFKEKLVARGMEAIASHNHFSLVDLKDRVNQVLPVLKEKQVDSVIIIRLADKKNIQEFRAPQYDANVTFPVYYFGWQNFYVHTYDALYDPGYLYGKEIYELETTLHQLEPDDLYWEALTKTSLNLEKDYLPVVKEYISVVVKQMAKDGVIP